ncbi:MAG: hypothetical protein AAGA48_24850 [Myxococcota bacterium]
MFPFARLLMLCVPACLFVDRSSDADGFTECGDFDECQPGTYCADATFGECLPGCTSDVNCASNQRCVDNEDDGVGVCASEQPPSQGAQATAEQRQRCKDDCDAYAFFECFDEVGRQDCFAGCETASGAQIEAFIACDGALDCDQSCISTHLP